MNITRLKLFPTTIMRHHFDTFMSHFMFKSIFYYAIWLCQAQKRILRPNTTKRQWILLSKLFNDNWIEKKNNVQGEV